MGKKEEKIQIDSNPPTVIMLCGLQGAGKTTHAGKLARYFLKQNKRPLLVACDIYRPAAIKQLQVVGKSVDVPVFTIDDWKDITNKSVYDIILFYINIRWKILVIIFDKK